VRGICVCKGMQVEGEGGRGVSESYNLCEGGFQNLTIYVLQSMQDKLCESTCAAIKHWMWKWGCVGSGMLFACDLVPNLIICGFEGVQPRGRCSRLPHRREDPTD